MAWKQKDFDEVTAAIEENRQEISVSPGRFRQSRGKLANVKSLELEKMIRRFEERARAAPESLPEPPWQKNVDGVFYCDCGECDGRGRIIDEVKGVRFCAASHAKARSRVAEDSLDLGSIFDK